MCTFLARLDTKGDGPRLAVKDLIDVEGLPTTAGSRAVESLAVPAASDAPLLCGARAAGARLVGKTNLYELAFGASGVNDHYGTPRNPLDARCLPGGSSSGSAVAVACEEADVAYGSDTGGSIRVPAAFCGIAGLKTTIGRVDLTGVFPLAPSLDTVGPMARDVEGLIRGMQLLEPEFRPTRCAESIGIVRVTQIPVDPLIDAAVQTSCRLVERELFPIELATFTAIFEAAETVLQFEAARSNARLIREEGLFAMLSAAVQRRLLKGVAITEHSYNRALARRASWNEELRRAFEKVDILALPAVGFFPPPLAEAPDHIYTHLTLPVNFAGLPAVAIPVPVRGSLPASLQLVGPAGSEEMLLATASRFEDAIAL